MYPFPWGTPEISRVSLYQNRVMILVKFKLKKPITEQRNKLNVIKSGQFLTSLQLKETVLRLIELNEIILVKSSGTIGKHPLKAGFKQ
jgi:hypothetical protein